MTPGEDIVVSAVNCESLTTPQVARLLGASARTVREWTARGLLRSHARPPGRGVGGRAVTRYCRLADIVQFAHQHGLHTHALASLADHHGIGTRLYTLLLVTTDPFLSPALIHAGYDVTQADSSMLAGWHLGRKRFDAALIDCGVDGWLSVHEMLTYHAPAVAVGLLTPEDRPPTPKARCWQKPVDARHVAVELLEELRKRR